MTEVMVALITGGLSFFGVVLTNIFNHKKITDLIDYRLDILEKKQDKYNNVLERMQNLETAVRLLERDKDNLADRLEDLKGE